MLDSHAAILSSKPGDATVMPKNHIRKKKPQAPYYLKAMTRLKLIKKVIYIKIKLSLIKYVTGPNFLSKN